MLIQSVCLLRVMLFLCLVCLMFLTSELYGDVFNPLERFDGLHGGPSAVEILANVATSVGNVPCDSGVPSPSKADGSSSGNDSPIRATASPADQAHSESIEVSLDSSDDDVPILGSLKTGPSTRLTLPLVHLPGLSLAILLLQSSLVALTLTPPIC